MWDQRCQAFGHGYLGTSVNRSPETPGRLIASSSRAQLKGYKGQTLKFVVTVDGAGHRDVLPEELQTPVAVYQLQPHPEFG